MQTSCGVREEMYRPVLPSEKIRVAFLFQIASFWPSWENLYEKMSRDERFDCKLYLVTDDVDKSKQLATAQNFLDANNIRYEFFSDSGFGLFAPHVAFVQTPYDYTQRAHHLYARRLKQQRIRVIYIPYGIEIVDTRAARHNHFREPVIRNAWRIYTASNEFEKEYKRYCENYTAVRGLGLPRFDVLKQRDKFTLPTHIKEKKNGRKIILWQAHFTKKIRDNGFIKQVTPYLEDYIRFAEKLSQYDEELFVFHAHPRFAADLTDVDSNRKAERLLNILHACENVCIDMEEEYRPLLLNSDAIIIDRSALSVEAGLVGVPVLYMQNPDFAEPIFPPLRSLFEGYCKGSSYKDMADFMKQFSENKLKVKHDINALNVDGMASDRIIEDIAASVYGFISKPKKEKLILFGTGFIYQTMMKMNDWKLYAEIVAIADNDSKKWRNDINGVTVIPPSTINEFEFDKVVICTENIFEEEVEKQLLYDLEIPKNKVEHCDYLATLGG